MQEAMLAVSLLLLRVHWHSQGVENDSWAHKSMNSKSLCFQLISGMYIILTQLVLLSHTNNAYSIYFRVKLSFWIKLTDVRTLR